MYLPTLHLHGGLHGQQQPEVHAEGEGGVHDVELHQCIVIPR